MSEELVAKESVESVESEKYVHLAGDFLIDGWCIGTFFFETF